MFSNSSKKLRREQIDRALNGPVNLRHLLQPKRGWLREVREMLGMSAQQLAHRLQVTQQTVAKMEKTEVAETISLASLRRVAEAMNCRLVYAFVPHESFDAILREQAIEVATRLLDRVEHTMALEAQEQGSGSSKEKRIADVSDELVRTLSRDLWKERVDSRKTQQERQGKQKQVSTARNTPEKFY